jgi:Flp pilus assembly pilin Flp
MKAMLKRLWRDDEGAVLASEFVFLVTALGIGTVAGLASVRDAVNHELTEVANAHLSLSQGYYLSGQIGCCAITDGSEAIDTPAKSDDPRCTPGPKVAVCDNLGCN